MTELKTTFRLPPTLDQTIQLVKDVYGDEPNKTHTGPLSAHPIAVMHLLPTSDIELKQAALLHDILEDSPELNMLITSQDLRQRGYSERVIRIVELVSKIPDVGVYKKGMEYSDWIKALVHSNEPDTNDAILLKYIDVSLNRTDKRINQFEPGEREVMRDKYRLPYFELERAVRERGLLPKQLEMGERSR